jgi:hypothetical protein
MIVLSKRQASGNDETGPEDRPVDDSFVRCKKLGTAIALGCLESIGAGSFAPLSLPC